MTPAGGDFPQPLAGIRVVELATGVAGPYAGKLLADFGADVLKVEPPSGDPARSWGAFTGPDPGLAVAGQRGAPEVGTLHLHLNANKRSVVADLASPVGRSLVASLIARADVVIESFTPGFLDGVGMGWDVLSARHPRLVVASVTPFGQSGPYGSWRGSEITAYAMGGPMHATGIAEREPLKLGGHEVSYHCGGVVALATIAALTMAEAGGVGSHIDISNFETQAGSIDRRATWILQYAYNGRVMAREPRDAAGLLPSGLYPSTDGYVQVGTPPRFGDRLLATIGAPELEALLADPAWMLNPDVPGVAEAAVYQWLAERSSAEAMAEAQPRHWPVTALRTPIQVLSDEHLAARDFWQDLDHPEAGRVRHPGPPVRLRGAWVLARPAPLLDQHRGEVAAELAGAPNVRPGPAVVSSSPLSLPLAGIRVLDLTVVWAGPYTTMLLGDLGAEVIRVENPNFYTGTRGSSARPSKAQLPALSWLNAHPDSEPGARPWNRNAFFNNHARNKLGASVDITKTEGREAFLRLVERSDVLVENNAVGVLEKLGIGWDVLQARNPKLVLLRMPALGLSGPWAHYVGFGANFEALSGLTALRGYPDESVSTTHSVYYMDAASGVMGATSVLLALRRRAADPAGRGELIELAQAENMLNHIGEYLIDAGLHARSHEPLGNHDVAMAPQGAYRCSGEDRWVTLTVTDDDNWRALRRAMGEPLWAEDRRFDDAAGRRAQHSEIDRLIGNWTAAQDRFAVADRLQAEGVAAGPVLDEADLFLDRHLRARGFFRPNGSVEVGPHDYPGHLWRWSGPALRWDPLCRFGADNDYVWREAAGLDEPTYDALRAAGHISMDYFAADGRPL